MDKELDILKKKLEREKNARKQAEAILEAKALELYNTNQELVNLNSSLENLISQRTESLLLSELQYKTLVQNLQVGILLEDSERKVILANLEFCNLFSLSIEPETLKGINYNHVADLFGGLLSDKENFNVRVEELLENNKIVPKEIIYLKNGKILNRSFVPIFSNGKRISLLWKYEDITEQVKIDDLIRKSEEKYRGIIENMELGLLEVDNNDIILKAYPKFCELTGYSKDELLGFKAMDILLPDDQLRQLVKQQNENRKEGQAGVYEIPIKRKNGEIIWLIISGTPVYNSNGEITGSLGIHLNITASKKTQEALIEANKIAEQARQHEKRFLANMSHEIRTPINGIIGMSHLLSDTELTDQQNEYLGGLMYSADILMSLISDILDISKIEAGEMEMSEQEFSLKNLLTSILFTFKPKLKENNCSLDFKIDSEIQTNVIGDTTFLTQILMNLVSNAVKFTKNGQVLIEINLLCRLGDVLMTEFKVTDTGIGIKSEDLDNVFELFKQANSSIKGEFGGTGLGLAIVKQLVKIHGGEIYVDSTIGKGTTFTFTLPLKDSRNFESTKKETKTKLNSKLEGAYILVAEDNLMNQKYLIGLLKKWNFRYELATNGFEALEFCKSQKFDLILMDIEMPKLNGLEATKSIREDFGNPNNGTYVLALTASAMTEDIEKFKLYGFNSFLLKPFTPDQITSKLNEILIQK